jgi:RNA polymerase-binding transcription factor DksA
MERRRRISKRARASTQDVLGTAVQSQTRISPKWRQHYDALISFRNRLLERKGMLVRDAAEEQPVYSLHMADAGTDNFNRDFALSIASSEQDALYEVDQALNRIREGSYGVCEMTGKPIEPERLKAVPWARFSASAENELERNGTVKRAKLGQLATLPAGGEPDREEEEADEE